MLRGLRNKTNPVCTAGPAARFPRAPYLVHHLLGLPISDSEAASLVVCAVRTGDQLTEGSRARKPGLQVKLLTGSVIQRACKETPLEFMKEGWYFRRLTFSKPEEFCNSHPGPRSEITPRYSYRQTLPREKSVIF